MVNAEEQGVQVQQRIEQDLGRIHRGVEVQWKRLHHWGTCEWKVGQRTFCKEQEENRNSQGKNPRTLEENSQGGDLSTPKTNSQGEDPRTYKEPVERWRVEKKWKDKNKKQEEKKHVKDRGRSWWKKCKERIASFFTAKRKEETEEHEGRKSDVPERDKSW